MARLTARARKPWETRIGAPPVVVWCGERAGRAGRVYLRWWGGQNWKSRSLGFGVRTESGALDDTKVAAAIDAAAAKWRALTGRATDAPTPQRPLTLGETWGIVAHPATGRYPSKTAYRDELEAALTLACSVLGADFAWVAFHRPQLRAVTRAAVDRALARGRVGFRTAEVVGTRLLTVAASLKAEGRLPVEYVPPGGRDWKQELRAYVEEKRGQPVPEPARPRHTIAEVRQLLAVSAGVDPRFRLLFALGAELRLGQVVRAPRSALHLEAGTFRAPGRGKKRGELVVLTPGQLAVVREILGGFHAEREAVYQAEGRDYQLFPGRGGRGIAGKTAVMKWFRAAERAAGIAHAPGRGAYGARRVAVDEAIRAGASRGVLQAIGGWSDARTPEQIYRDQERHDDRTAAATVRAVIRGEP